MVASLPDRHSAARRGPLVVPAAGEHGFGVPDGKVDADDYAVFVWAYNNDNLIADVTTTGFTTPSGGGANGEPDEIIDGDDLIYFLDFYSDCDNQDCPACP